jgi:hypothetical protein
MDLIKAALFGAVLIAGVVMLPVIIAALTFLVGYAILVAIIWFVFQIVKEEPKPPD